MSTISRKLVAISLVAAFSMVMYGCGGGGGSSSDPVEPPVEPPPPVNNVDLSKVSTATLVAGTHDIAAGMSHTVGDITFTCASGGAACALTIAADGTATSTGGVATADYSDAAKTRMAKAATDKANAISTALAKDTATTPAANNGVPSGVTITRSTTGTTKVTPTLDGNATAQYGMSANSLPAISGWTAQSLSRSDDDAPMENINIYTDINNATPQKLEYAAGDAVFTPSANNLIILDATPKTTGSYSADDTITGTIQGVHGTFTCASGCNLPSVYGDAATGGVNPNTVDAAMSDWSFKSTNNHEPSATQDSDYLYFGYWIHMPTDANDAYDFVTLAGGSDNYDGNPSGLGGKKATYNGAAAGKYVKKQLGVVDGSLSTTSARSGAFTATVMLNAVFGVSNDIPVNDQNRISGTISKFMDGDEDLGFLVRVVGLINSDSTVDVTSDGASFNAFHGTTPHDAGAWTGTLFGPHQTTGDNPTAIMPSGVAGVFDAHFTDGNISGGYAATR